MSKIRKPSPEFINRFKGKMSTISKKNAKLSILWLKLIIVSVSFKEESW